MMGCEKTEQRPRLVILLSVDQLAYHSYSHYLPVFTKGFKWLHDHGVTFSNAHFEHGYAGTGPGHFVLGSGLYPGPAGFIGNSWYVRERGRNVYCVEDSSAHALDIPANSVSYRNVNGSTIGDWLKAVSPESKSYAVACKDRSAILMGGKYVDAAIWYNWRGEFTSNDYYLEKTPQWLHNFNSNINMISYRDSLWTKSMSDEVYLKFARADSFYGENDRYLNEPYSPTFPIGFEEDWDEGRFFGELGGRPWIDRMTLELASAVIENEKLGLDNIPDVLTIGVSALDIVGHRYGPYSQEALDFLIKLDSYLESFLKRLDTQVGLENVLIALSTDHGILPLPEYWSQVQGQSGGRIDGNEYKESRNRAYSTIEGLFGTHDFIHRSGSSYYYDYLMIDSLQVNIATVDSIMQAEIESIKGIHRLYTRSELLNPDPNDPLTIRLSRFTHPELSPDLYTLQKKGWLFYGPYGTNHSTPYDYDSHVPIIFSNSQFNSTNISDSVTIYDVAPTLGDFLGAAPTNRINGVSLRSYLSNN